MFYFNKNNAYITQSKYQRGPGRKKIRNRILMVLVALIILSVIGAVIAFSIGAAISNSHAIYGA